MNKNVSAKFHLLDAKLNRVTSGGVTNIIESEVVLSVGGANQDGDYIGTSVTPQYFENAVLDESKTGIVKSLVITDKNTTAAVNMELWLFKDTFTAPTDNAAWAITDADNKNCIGVIPLSSSKWYAHSNGKTFTDDTINLPVKPNGRHIYYALVARDTTPAWSSLDLNIQLGILLDF